MVRGLYVWFLAAFFSWAPAGWAQSPATSAPASAARPRMAIVGNSTGPALPAGMLELIEQESLKLDGLRLVERMEVRRIIREQSLTMTPGDGIYLADAVTLGRLAAADLFLLVESAPLQKEKGTTSLRLRLIESHHGLKLADSAWVLDAGHRAEEHAASIARWVHKHVRRLAEVQQAPVVIAVTSFLSKELSPRWNWLCDILPAGVEQQLVAAPGLVLAERHRTGHLIDERTLTAELPESLRASAVLIEASFQVNRAKALDAIVVALRGRRGAEVIFETMVEGSSNSTGQLTADLAAAILKQLGRTRPVAAMDRRAEAKLLIAQAEAYSKMGDGGRAIAPLEAAIALAPEMIEPKVLLIGAANPSHEAWGLRELRGEQRDDFLGEAVPACFRNLSLGEQVLARADLWLRETRDWQSPDHKDRVLSTLGNLFLYPLSIRRSLGDGSEPGEILDQMRPALRALHGKYLVAARELSNRHYHFMLSQSIASAQWWCDSPEEYLVTMRQTMELAAQAPREPTSAGFIRVLNYLDGPSPWINRHDVRELYLRFLGELSQQEDILIRAAAQLSFAHYYAGAAKPPDQELARQHYRAFIAMLVGDIIPHHPELENDIPLWARQVQFEPLERGRLLAKVARAQLELGMRRDSDAWELVIRPAMEELEKGGKPDEAEALLEFTIQKGVPTHAEKLRGWLTELRVRHPDLKPVEAAVPSREFKMQAVLKVADLAGMLKAHGFGAAQPMLRRLMQTPSGLVVALSDSASNAAGQSYAVVRLEKGSLRPRVTQVFEGKVRFDSRSANVQMIYGRWGPASAADGDAVFLGFPGAGILRFPPEGKAMLMTEDTGLASGNIGQLATMHGKLYAVVKRDWADVGLMEVDLSSGSSRIVLSSTEEKSLIRCESFQIVSDPDRRRLLLALYSSTQGQPKGIHSLEPSTGRTEVLNERFNTFYIDGWRGKHLILHSAYGAGLLDPASGDMTWLLSQPPGKDASRRAHWTFPLSIGPTLLVDGGLVCLAAEPGQKLDIYHFSEDRDGPVVIRGGGWPGADSLRGMLATEDGLLLLTADAIYRLPELHTSAGDAATQPGKRPPAADAR